MVPHYIQPPKHIIWGFPLEWFTKLLFMAPENNHPLQVCIQVSFGSSLIEAWVQETPLTLINRLRRWTDPHHQPFSGSPKSPNISLLNSEQAFMLVSEIISFAVPIDKWNRQKLDHHIRHLLEQSYWEYSFSGFFYCSRQVNNTQIYIKTGERFAFRTDVLALTVIIIPMTVPTGIT